MAKQYTGFKGSGMSPYQSATVRKEKEKALMALMSAAFINCIANYKGDSGYNSSDRESAER